MIELPELPDSNFVDIDGHWYNEAKLREYARLAADEALERAAQECDKLGASSCSLDFEDCAAAIRQLKGKP